MMPPLASERKKKVYYHKNDIPHFLFTIYNGININSFVKYKILLIGFLSSTFDKFTLVIPL